MRNESQKTLIGVIRAYVSQWRKREGWSREAVVDAIVAAHVEAGMDGATGLKFSDSRDVFERMKVNADRVFRWLDDETKDSTLLPANFLPSLLTALPADLRLRAVDELLSPLGLSVTNRGADAHQQIERNAHLVTNIREASEAHAALAQLPPNPTIDQLRAARIEFVEAAAAANKTVQALDDEIAKAATASAL